MGIVVVGNLAGFDARQHAPQLRRSAARPPTPPAVLSLPLPLFEACSPLAEEPAYQLWRLAGRDHDLGERDASLEHLEKARSEPAVSSALSAPIVCLPVWPLMLLTTGSRSDLLKLRGVEEPYPGVLDRMELEELHASDR